MAAAGVTGGGGYSKEPGSTPPKMTSEGWSLKLLTTIKQNEKAPVGVEVKQAPWSIKALWVWKKGDVKCTVPLVDTVLTKGPSPLWLFTTRDGEVRKKRECSGPAVRKRFLQMLRSNPPGRNSAGRCCILRLGDREVTLLDAPALAALTHEHEDFPPRSEGPGLEAVQFFVPSGGSSGTLVFRGTYRLLDEKGRHAFAATSFSLLPPELASAPGAVRGGAPAPDLEAKVLSPQLLGRLEAATLRVVRSIESTQRCKVLKLGQMDWVQDGHGKLWLSWVGAATVASGPVLADLGLAGLGNFRWPAAAVARGTQRASALSVNTPR